MSDQLPPIEDDDFSGETIKADPQRTRANIPTGHYPQQPPAQPPPASGHIQRVRPPQPGGSTRTGSVIDPRRKKQSAHKDSGLYLPLWSLAIMLIVVLGISAGIVLVVYLMGGGIAEEADPIIVIVTAEPSNTPSGEAGSVQTILATATLPPLTQEISIPGDLALSGPTLAPVQISPTPQPLAINSNVIVDGVGDNQLNVRNIAGVNGSEVLFRAVDGSPFIIVAGPQQADGFTWWQIQDPTNPSLTGWAVSNYLRSSTAAQTNP